MRLRLKLAAGVAVLGVAGIGTAAIAHDNSRFDANLTGYEEVPTLSTSGTGTFKAWINRGKDEIRYVLTYAGPFPRFVHRNAMMLPAGLTARAPRWICACVTVPPAGLASNGPAYVSVYRISSLPRLTHALNVPVPDVDSVGISS